MKQEIVISSVISTFIHKSITLLCLIVKTDCVCQEALDSLRQIKFGAFISLDSLYYMGVLFREFLFPSFEVLKSCLSSLLFQKESSLRFRMFSLYIVLYFIAIISKAVSTFWEKFEKTPCHVAAGKLGVQNATWD